MQARQKLTFGLSILFAAVAGVLFWGYLKSLDRPTAQQAQRIVFVAAKDIQARSPITPGALESVSRPISAVDLDAVQNLSEVQGMVALTTIPAGAALTRSRIGKAEIAPMAAQMRPGTRAVTIGIDSVRGVASLVQPGDRVDVMAIQRVPGSSAAVAKVTTIMRGVLVLAMGRTTEQSLNASHAAGTDPTTGDAPTATLALNPKDAEELATADATATLRLSLRPAKESVPRTASQPYVLLTPPPTPVPQAAPVASASQQRVVVVRPAAAPRPKARGPVVTVIDGDHVVGAGQ